MTPDRDAAFIVDLASALAQPTTLAERFTGVVDAFARRVNADAAVLLLRGLDAEEYWIPWGFGEDSTSEDLPISRSTIEQARALRDVVFIRDTQLDGLTQTRSIVQHGLKWIVVVPLREPPLDGLLYAHCTNEAEHEMPSPGVLRMIARLMAQPVQNVRAEKEQSFRLEVLSALVHTLRSPTQSILAAGRLLADGSAPPDRRAEVARDLETLCLHLSKSVADAYTVAAWAGVPADPSASQPIAVDPKQVIETAVRYLTYQPGPALRCAPDPDLPVLHLPPARLQTVLTSLVTNARRHADPATTVTVRATQADTRHPDAPWAMPSGRDAWLLDHFGAEPAETVDGWLWLTVHNTGAPIDPTLRQTLFDARVTSRTDGMGLGLTIVALSARRSGGSAWADCDASGTTFGVSFPVTLQE
ncbi:MAG: signal transduction histidine kinase [Myxococcota bacterium]|jgi:signal transduction histidine kinase